MRNLFLGLACLVGLPALAATNPVSLYPNKPVPADTDLLLIAIPGATNANTTVAQFRSLMKTTNAADLTAGTLPLGRLSGITGAQMDPATDAAYRNTGGGTPAGVTAFNSRTGAVALTSTDITNALGYAPIGYSDISDSSANPLMNITPATNMAKAYPFGNMALAQGSAWGIQSPHTTETNLQWFVEGPSFKIRQAGTIKGIAMNILNTNNLVSFQARVWRTNSATGRYNCVVESGNLLGSMPSSGTNLIPCNMPGVQPWDAISFHAKWNTTLQVPFQASSTMTGNSSYVSYNSDDSTNNVDIHSWTGVASYACITDIYMEQSPGIVFIGDSIMGGNKGYIAAAMHIPDIVGTNVGATYQGMGVGGESMNTIQARIPTDVVALHPKVCVIEGGVNDVTGGATSNTIIGFWTAALNQLTNAGITPVVIGILPQTWSMPDNYFYQQWGVNAWLAANVRTGWGGYYADLSPYVGTNDPARGPQPNHWAPIPAYEVGDHLHWNLTGDWAISTNLIQMLNSTKRGMAVGKLYAGSLTLTNTDGGNLLEVVPEVGDPIVVVDGTGKIPGANIAPNSITSDKIDAALDAEYRSGGGGGVYDPNPKFASITSTNAGGTNQFGTTALTNLAPGVAVVGSDKVVTTVPYGTALHSNANAFVLAGALGTAGYSNAAAFAPNSTAGITNALGYIPGTNGAGGGGSLTGVNTNASGVMDPVKVVKVTTSIPAIYSGQIWIGENTNNTGPTLTLEQYNGSADWQIYTDNGGTLVITNRARNMGFCVMPSSGLYLQKARMVNTGAAATPAIMFDDTASKETGIWSPSSGNSILRLTSSRTNYLDITATNCQAVGDLVAGGALISGIRGHYFPSNSLANWPAAPRTRGEAYFGNSNGVVYLLTSADLANLQWAATNKLAP